MMAKLLVIDNYDSFTFNLVQMFRQFQLDIRVFRSDRITLEQVNRLDPDYILISPGPKDPAHAGISIALVKAYHRKIPILGVCLGMQCINEAFGGQTDRAPIPMHGKTSPIHHCQRLLFSGMPSPFTAARYHSLIVTPTRSALETDLTITARSDDKVIMGLSHQHYPLHGVQFHPESFLTQAGLVLVENFLRLGPLHSQLARAA